MIFIHETQGTHRELFSESFWIDRRRIIIIQIWIVFVRFGKIFLSVQMQLWFWFIKCMAVAVIEKVRMISSCGCSKVEDDLRLRLLGASINFPTQTFKFKTNMYSHRFYLGNIHVPFILLIRFEWNITFIKNDNFFFIAWYEKYLSRNIICLHTINWEEPKILIYIYNT